MILVNVIKDSRLLEILLRSITISAPANQAPVAQSQSVTTDEDVAKEVTLRASDVENDSVPLNDANESPFTNPVPVAVNAIS